MSAATATLHSAPTASRPSRLPLVLILLGVVLTALFIVAPVVVIFAQAFSKGWSTYVAGILQPDTLHAVLLTVLVTIAVVPVNLVFGVGAAWLIAKFDFPGKKLLLTVIEIPFSISPIVAGVTYILLYGGQGLLGDFLMEHDLQIMFALPAILWSRCSSPVPSWRVN